MKNRIFRNVLLVLISVIFVSCVAYTPESGEIVETFSRPKKLYRTKTAELFKKLPRPERKIYVAVYGVSDQTGQYQKGDTTTDFSTAVPQSGLPVLVSALRKTGWFEVIDRSGLNDLITERKVFEARNKRIAKINGTDVYPVLNPLNYGAFLVKGSVVAYDTNVSTKGGGARYFGAGGSVEIRTDVVTFALSLQSVANGTTQADVMVQKKIVSWMVDGGIFRYVSFKRLLEVDLGLSSNEPRSIAFMEVIHKAVMDLICEAILNGTWRVADTKIASTNEIFLDYIEARDGVRPEKIQFPY